MRGPPVGRPRGTNMTDAEFAALVARLDQQARRSPAAYRLKVILLAYAGYAYVAFVLAGAGMLFIAALATLPYLNCFSSAHSHRSRSPRHSPSSSVWFSVRSFGSGRARCGCALSGRKGIA